MIAIRLASEKDAAALQEIYRLCIIEATWQIRPSETIPDFVAVSCGETIWVAVDSSDQVQALLAVQEDHSYIHHLYVHPLAQGRGAERALLQHLQTQLACPWQLKCVASNHAAMAFYRHLGWRELEAGTGEDGSYYLLQFV
ncbi:acetyltransferase [Undibacterium sp. KW1]|uniref:GNAT family N-acetyltransferase n=1 Tax=Undibacterium sp. KW1 TaxID=2058624 RepID=UPI001331D332|nr:GNAT family N-acetyltransferase [Undibacterium sp. KW1]BBB58437.1 acetyltransferase [Undibacterium sp. KW1]